MQGVVRGSNGARQLEAQAVRQGGRCRQHTEGEVPFLQSLSTRGAKRRY